MIDTDIKPTWTVSKYEDSLKDMDICIQTYDEDVLVENISDYIDRLPLFKEKDIPDVVESAKEVKIFEKNRFKLDVEDLTEYVYTLAYEDYNMDDTDHVNGIELVKDFCNKFNEKQHWYTSGRQIGFLDLSQEVKEYYLEEKHIPKEEWDETWEKWLRLK